MAKHKIDGKGRVSKGLRLSSRPLPKVSIYKSVRGNTKDVPNEMRKAFLECPILSRNHPAFKLDGLITQRLVHHAKLSAVGYDYAHKGKGWNAHLSHATYTDLHSKGYL